MAKNDAQRQTADIIDFRDYYQGLDVNAPLVKRRRKGSGPQRRAAARKTKAADAWMPAVTHDWPEGMPVSEAELDVFEAHFGDFIDELLGSN
jgi:hypothetical protein